MCIGACAEEQIMLAHVLQVGLDDLSAVVGMMDLDTIDGYLCTQLVEQGSIRVVVVDSWIAATSVTVARPLTMFPLIRDCGGTDSLAESYTDVEWESSSEQPKTAWFPLALSTCSLANTS